MTVLGYGTASADEQICPEDEDIHFCLCCRMLIHGLDQYVLHRRQKCQMGVGKQSTCGRQVQQVVSNLSSFHNVSKIIPGSSVSVTNGASPLIRGYDQLEMLNNRTPTKTSRSDPVLSSSSNHIVEHLKPNQSAQSLVHDLSVEVSADDFMNQLGLSLAPSSTWPGDMNTELRADDFFSLLELQSCSKHLKTPDTSKQKCQSQRNTKTPHESNRTPTSRTEPELCQEDLLLLPRQQTFSSPPPTISPETTTKTPQTLDPPPTTPVPISRPFPSRGKWMPGLKPRDIYKSGSLVEYHCKPCNRRLTGRAVYEKHLQSELHFKRVASSQNNDNGPSCAQQHQQQYQLRQKKSTTTTMTLSLQQERMIDVLEEDVDGVDMSWIKRKRRVDKDSRRCPICDALVPRHSFAKHLVSRFHVSRSRKHPHNVDFILDNMQIIVQDAPFQCRPCRFYSHSHDTLLLHWSSLMHQQLCSGDNRSAFRCSLCRFSCMGNHFMQRHLESPEHRNCVNIVNQSISVIVNKISLIECHVCAKRFRLNVQLNKHLSSVHGLTDERDQDENGPAATSYACQHCANFHSKSKSAFTHHLFKCSSVPDSESLYRCLICQVAFASKDQVVKHRSSQEHRDLAIGRRSGASNRPRCCPHCYQTFANLSELKEHSQNQHAELLPRCTSCGQTFALKQQLSAHRLAAHFF